MFGHAYDHKTIEKTVSAFGTLFNDIRLIRRKADGSESQRILVPLRYIAKKDWYYKSTDDKDLLYRFARSVPRIGFELTGMSYDSSRKLPTLNQNYHHVDQQRNIQYMGVPYNLSFSLYIEAENVVDMFQLIENILPYFGPSFTVTSNIMPELNLQEDIPFILTAVNPTIEFQGNIGDQKNVTCQMDFSSKIKLRGHITKIDIIRKVIVNLYEVTAVNSIENEEIDVIITTEPNPIDAEPTDDYDYTTTIENVS